MRLERWLTKWSTRRLARARAEAYALDRRPGPLDICTVCDRTLHKRAALLFDRVYIAPGVDVQEEEAPPELTFGFREGETQIVSCLHEILDEHPPSGIRDENFVDAVSAYAERALARAYARGGCTVVSSYPSYLSFEAAFSGGSVVAYEGALREISIVDDTKLSWEQIIEFRRDKESVRKYRELRLWLQSGLKANSVTEAADIIGTKLAAYDWAMRKHGLITLQGALTFVLDYRQAGVAALAVAGGNAAAGPIFGALAGGLVITGQITAWALGRYIDREDVKRGANCEVAFIHDINKRFGSP